jgi:RNA recognition motif. (a.k.a. RRM, RBD, or RNP domain)
MCTSPGTGTRESNYLRTTTPVSSLLIGSLCSSSFRHAWLTSDFPAACLHLPHTLVNSGDPRGFAFVRFVNRADADEAMAKMDGAEFKGRQLRIQYAMSRRPDNPREHYQQRAMSSRDAHRGSGGGGHRRSRYVLL